MTPKPIILVADRGDDALRCLKKELAATYTLLHAKDGEEALCAIDNQEAHIAVALIELELPVVNGLDLISRLTIKQPKPNKIIATTFIDDEVLFELARHVGADAVIRKPTPKKQLVEIVRSVLPESTEQLNGLNMNQCVESVAVRRQEDREKAPVVLVAAREEVLHSLGDALVETSLAVLHAQTKDEAMALLEPLKATVDVAIIDLELPELDGLDLIGQITNEPQRSVKIIALTSASPDAIVEKIKELGVDEVVRTSLPPEEWRRTVETVLKRTATA